MSENLKQAELAKQTLKVFEDQGEDMTAVRHVIHYFYNGNFNGLGSALKELGYDVRPTARQNGVVAERYEAIDENWRNTTLRHLCELADEYGVDYDGWEASMERAQVTAQTADAQKAGWLTKLFGKN